MSTSPQSGAPSTRTLSRRSVAAGLAWTAAAVAMAAAAPAFAASSAVLTGTNNTLQFYQDRYCYSAGPSTLFGTPTGSDLNRRGGYITTLGTPTSGTPKNRSGVSTIDGGRDPNTSIGLWVETANSTSGTARVNSVTQTYVFSQPITIIPSPTSGSQGGSYTWSQPTTLNGWTYTLSADDKTLTLKYDKSTVLNTSTSVAGTGDYLPGYFLNYTFRTSHPPSARTTTPVRSPCSTAPV